MSAVPAAAGSRDRATAPAKARVRAWDAPTRLFKWLLVALVIAAYATQARGAIGLHVLNGYAILILLVFRVLWGLFGSSTARFSHWLTWPWTAFRYGADIARGRASRYLGHNPLGGWMILALLALALAQGVTGLFTIDNNGLEGGPFANRDFGDPTPLQRAMMFWHFRGFYVLLGFAAIHVATNLWYQFGRHDPLITGMVIGTKPALPYADEPEMAQAGALWPRALACLAIAAAAVLGTVAAFGGRLPI